MPRIGVSDLHVAELTKDESGEVTYGSPKRIAGAINIGINKTVAEGELYADDTLDEYVAEMTAQEISLNTKDISNEHEALLLGKEIDDHGGVVDGGDDHAPYFAVMFRSRKSDGTYQYRVLYKVRFRPFDETFDTKSGSINFQTPTVTGRSMKRESDGRFGYKVDETSENRSALEDFFDKPFDPVFAS